DFVYLDNTYEEFSSYNYVRHGLMNLSDFKSSITFLGSTPALGHHRTKILHQKISVIINTAIAEISSVLIKNGEVDISNDNHNNLPQIFFSYAHEDEDARKEIERTLDYLQTYKIAKLWSDRKIPSGDIWSEEIEIQLNSSKIVLFLISRDFIRSKFIKNIETPLAIKNYENQECVCIPILLSKCH
ncbi:MAG: toll/interleukin-1 receptor domain-containing protein, partial [Chloroflexota bacterium]